MIDLPGTSQKHPTVKVGDIVLFSQNSCAWAHHCGLLEESHGLGSLGLVIEACSQEQRLSVFLLDFHENLSPWSNCLEYGDDSGATFDDAAYDIYAVVTTVNDCDHAIDPICSRCTISEDLTHSLYRIYFEKMIRAAQEELAVPDDIMREIREDTNDFDLGGFPSLYCGISEGAFGEIINFLESLLVPGVDHVSGVILDWFADMQAEDLDPSQLLDAIEAMQQDRDVRHKYADRLLRVWGRGVNGSGVRRQGFAGASCAQSLKEA